jgi:hypothetical protein
VYRSHPSRQCICHTASYNASVHVVWWHGYSIFCRRLKANSHDLLAQQLDLPALQEALAAHQNTRDPPANFCCHPHATPLCRVALPLLNITTSAYVVLYMMVQETEGQQPRPAGTAAGPARPAGGAGCPAQLACWHWWGHRAGGLAQHAAGSGRAGLCWILSCVA